MRACLNARPLAKQWAQSRGNSDNKGCVRATGESVGAAVWEGVGVGGAGAWMRRTVGEGGGKVQGCG